MAIDLKHIAESLGGAKSTSNGYDCRCPAHDDKKASLSISEGNKVALVAHCKRGCSFDSIKEALKDLGLWPESERDKLKDSLKSRKETISHKWKVRTIDGSQFSHKVRQAGKKMRWDPPLGELGLKNNDMALYNIDNALKSDEVVICEGEKAADYACKLGLAAVGTGCGASSIPSDGALNELNGKSVILWPDNDDAGYEHMRKISVKLNELGIKNKTIYVPGAHPKDDAEEFFEAGGTLEKFRNLPEYDSTSKKMAEINGRGPECGDRKRVVLEGGLYQKIDAAISILDDQKVFLNEVGLVKIVKKGSDEKGGELGSSVKTVPLSVTGIADMLSRWADFHLKVNTKKGDYEKFIDAPPEKVCKGILERGEYETLHNIRGILNAPFVRKDGTIFNKKGFDYKTGFYLSTTVPENKIPNSPDRLDAINAYAKLADLFSDFPFENPTSAAVPVAIILTLLARPAIGNVPVFALDASTPGSGKTLVADIVSHITTGRPSTKYEWHDGKSGAAELEKTMNTVSEENEPVMCFDNVDARHSFGGSTIERFVTSGGRVNFRILGSTKGGEGEWNTVIFATGNNLLGGIKDETRRRVMPCRLTPLLENPEDRSNFKFNPIIEHVKKNRVEYIAAALTILKYAIAIDSEDYQRWGSFESFAKLIPTAIKLASNGIDIMQNRKMVSSTDGDENSRIVDLFVSLKDTFGTSGFTSSSILSRANSNDELAEAIKELHFGEIPTSRKMAKTLSTKKDRIYKGMCIIDTGKRPHNKVMWRISYSNNDEEEQNNDFHNDDDNVVSMSDIDSSIPF